MAHVEVESFAKLIQQTDSHTLVDFVTEKVDYLVDLLEKQPALFLEMDNVYVSNLSHLLYKKPFKVYDAIKSLEFNPKLDSTFDFHSLFDTKNMALSLADEYILNMTIDGEKLEGSKLYLTTKFFIAQISKLIQEYSSRVPAFTGSNTLDKLRSIRKKLLKGYILYGKKAQIKVNEHSAASLMLKAMIEKGSENETLMIPLSIMFEEGGHAMLLEVKRKNKDFVDFLIFNTGDGVQHHFSKYVEINKVIPYLWFENVPVDLFTSSYFFQVLPRFEDLKLTSVSFYDGLLAIFSKYRVDITNYGVLEKYERPQISGSCSMSVLKAYLLYYLDESEYAEVLLASDLLSLKEIELRKDILRSSHSFLVSNIVEIIARNLVRSCQGSELFKASYDTVNLEELNKMMTQCVTSFVGKLAIEAYPIIENIRESLAPLPMSSDLEALKCYSNDSLSEKIVSEVDSILKKFDELQNLKWERSSISRSLHVDMLPVYDKFQAVSKLPFRTHLQEIVNIIKKNKNDECVWNFDCRWNSSNEGLGVMFKFYNAFNFMRTILPSNFEQTVAAASLDESLEILTNLDLISETLNQIVDSKDFDTVDLQSHILLISWFYHKRYLQLYDKEHAEHAKELLNFCLPFDYYRVFSQQRTSYYAYKDELQLRNILGPAFEQLECDNVVFKAENYEKEFPLKNTPDYHLFDLLRKILHSTQILEKMDPPYPSKFLKKCESHFIFEMKIGSLLTNSFKLVRNIYFRILGRLTNLDKPIQYQMIENRYSRDSYQYHLTFKLNIPKSIVFSPDSQNVNRINISNESLFVQDLESHGFLAFYTLTKRFQVDKTLFFNEKALSELEKSVSSVFLNELSISDVESFFKFYEAEFYSFMEKFNQKDLNQKAAASQDESNQDARIANKLAIVCSYVFKFLSEHLDRYSSEKFLENFIQYALNLPSEKLDETLFLDLAIIICDNDADYLLLFKTLSIVSAFKDDHYKFTTWTAHDAKRVLTKALSRLPSGRIPVHRIQDSFSRYFSVNGKISCEYDSERVSFKCSNPAIFVELLQSRLYKNNQLYDLPSNSFLESLFGTKKYSLEDSFAVENDSNLRKQIYKFVDIEGTLEDFQEMIYDTPRSLFVVWRLENGTVQIIKEKHELSKILWFLTDTLYVSTDRSVKVGNYSFDSRGFESGFKYSTFCSEDIISLFSFNHELLYKACDFRESVLSYTKTKFHNNMLQLIQNANRNWYLNNEIFADSIKDLNFPSEVSKLPLSTENGRRYMLIPALSTDNIFRTVVLVELQKRDNYWVPAASDNYECFLLAYYYLQCRFYSLASEFLDQIDHMYALTKSDIEIMDAITTDYETSSDSTPNKYVLLGKLLIIAYKNYRLHPENKKWSPKNAYRIIDTLLSLKHSVKFQDMVLNEFYDKYIFHDFLSFHIKKLPPNIFYWLENCQLPHKGLPYSALQYTDFLNYMKIDILYKKGNTTGNVTDLIAFFKDAPIENFQPYDFVKPLIEEKSGSRLSVLRDLMLISLAQGKTSKFSAALFFLPIALKIPEFATFGLVAKIRDLCERCGSHIFGQSDVVYESSSYFLDLHLEKLRSYFGFPEQKDPTLTIDAKWSLPDKPPKFDFEEIMLKDFEFKNRFTLLREFQPPSKLQYFVGNFEYSFYKARHNDVLASWNSSEFEKTSHFVFQGIATNLEALKHLKNIATNYIEHLESLVKDAKQSALDLLDDVLSEAVKPYRAIVSLGDIGYESRVKDFKKLNHCVSRNDLACIRRLAQISTDSQAKKLRDAILQFVFYLSISKYLEKRVVEFIESSVLELTSKEEFENIFNVVALRFSKLMTKRKYMADSMKLNLNHSSMLLFEEFGSLILKKSQTQDIFNGTKYIAGTHNFEPNVTQRMMASGKTFVLATFFAFYKADGFNLSVIIQPTSLAYDNFASLSKRSLSAFGQSSFVLWYDRSPGKFTVDYLQYIKFHLIDAIKTRKYVLMTIESCQALGNRYLDALESNYSVEKNISTQEINLLKDILLIFKTRAVATVDEIDMVLNPTKELNFPTRKRDKIDPLLAKLFSELFKRIALDNRFADLGLNLLFPSQVTVCEENWAKIRKMMVDHLLEEIWPSHGEGSEYFSFLKFPNIKSRIDFIHELKQFLLSDTTPQFWWIIEALDKYKDKAEFLLIMRKQVQEWLVFAFKKVNNQHFGRSLKDPDYKLAKPYAAANSPNERSVFSDKFETFNKTFQMYLAQGLDESQLAALLVELKQQARLQALTVKDKNMAATRIGAICVILFKDDINFFYMTESEIKLNVQNYLKLFEESKLSHGTRKLYLDVMIDFVLKTVILPAEFFVEQISASSFDFCHMFNTVSGYSGTISNKNVLPHSVLVKESEYFKPDVRSDGRIMRLLVSRNDIVGVIDDIKQKDDFSIIFERFFSNEVWTKTPESAESAKFSESSALTRTSTWKKNLSAIIDSGALFKQFSNEMVAKGLSDYFKGLKNSTKTHVLYYDSDDQEINCISISTLEKRKLKPCNEAQILSVCGAKLSQIFMYYDQYHTTGSDVPFSGTATAILTVDSSTSLRDILQGGMRMRKLFDSQHLVIFVERKLASYIEERVTPILNSDEKFSLSVKSILLFSELVGFDQELVENSRIAFLKIFSAYKSYLISKMYSSEKDVEIYSAFRDKFFIRNVAYDFKAWIAPTKASSAKSVLENYATNLRRAVVNGLRNIFNADFSSEMPDHQAMIDISIKALPETLTVSNLDECNLGVSSENEVKQEQSMKALAEVVNESTVDSSLIKYEPIEQDLWPKIAISELSQKIIANCVESIKLTSLNSLLTSDSLLKKFSNLFNEKILFSDNFYRTATVTESELHLFGRFSKLAYYALLAKYKDDYRFVLLSLAEAKYFSKLLKMNPNQQELQLFYIDDKKSTLSPSGRSVSILDADLIELLLLGSQYEIIGKHQEMFLKWLLSSSSDLKVKFLMKFMSQGIYHQRFVNSPIPKLINQFSSEECDKMDLLKRSLTNADTRHCSDIISEITVNDSNRQALYLLAEDAFRRGATEAVGQAIISKLLEFGFKIESEAAVKSLLESIRSVNSFNYLKKIVHKDLLRNCKKYSNFQQPKNPEFLGMFVECLLFNYLNYSDVEMLSTLGSKVWDTILYITTHFDAGGHEDLWKKAHDLVDILVQQDRDKWDEKGYKQLCDNKESIHQARWKSLIQHLN